MSTGGNYSNTTSGYTVDRQTYSYDTTSGDMNTMPQIGDFGGTSQGEHHATGYQSWMDSMTSLQAAVVDAQSAYDSSAVEAEAAVEASYLDAEARKVEANLAMETSIHKDETDIEIAQMEADIEWEKLAVERDKIEQVDAVNAQANMRASDALFMEAEAEMEEAEAERDEVKYDYMGGDDSSVW